MMEHGTLSARIMALSLLFGAMLLAWFGAVAPYLSLLSRSDEQLAATMTQLHNYGRAAARASADTPGAKAGIDAMLLPGKTSAAAAAYLQQRSSSMVADSGAILLSFELLPAGNDGEAPLEVITGRIRVTANTQSLRSLLYALEVDRPLLALDNIYVRGRSSLDTIPGGHLDVQIDISGYRQVNP